MTLISVIEHIKHTKSHLDFYTYHKVNLLFILYNFDYYIL